MERSKKKNKKKKLVQLNKLLEQHPSVSVYDSQMATLQMRFVI